MIYLKNLFVTQNNVRNAEQIPMMEAYVRAGGVFNKHSLLTYALCKDIPISPLIQISLVEGEYYVSDGHHRAVAIYRAGRCFLFNEEYEVAEYSDYEYYTLSLDRNWITPFNLKTQCRKPDISQYKKTINWFRDRGMTEAISMYAEDAADQYREPREKITIAALSEAV